MLLRWFAAHGVPGNVNTRRGRSRGDPMRERDQRRGGRLVFRYARTHGSRRNRVAVCSCILSRCTMRYGNFPSDELFVAVVAFIQDRNDSEARAVRRACEGLPRVR